MQLCRPPVLRRWENQRMLSSFKFKAVQGQLLFYVFSGLGLVNIPAVGPHCVSSGPRHAFEAYSCAAVDKISTDIVHCTVPLIAELVVMKILSWLTFVSKYLPNFLRNF